MTTYCEYIKAYPEDIFKKTFVFTGGEIVNEFLMSTGYLPGAHQADCPIFRKMKKQNPPWTIIK